MTEKLTEVEPMFDLELTQTENGLGGSHEVTATSAMPDLPITQQHRDATAKLLMLGIQLSIISGMEVETKDVRGLAAGMAPVITEMLRPFIPEMTKVLLEISNPNRNEAVVDGKIATLTSEFESLFTKARRAVTIVESRK